MSLHPYKQIAVLLSQAKALASVVMPEFHDEIGLKRIVNSREAFIEIAVLEAMMECSFETFKERFMARCAWRQEAVNEASSFAILPTSASNRLYFEIACIVFAPKDITTLFSILMPNTHKTFRINIPEETPSNLTLKERKECHEHDSPLVEVCGLTFPENTPVSLDTFSKCIFFEDKLFYLPNSTLLTLPLDWHVKCYDLLSLFYPEFSQKLYQHNLQWCQLKSDILQLKGGLTPHYIFKDLIWGLRLGGERYTGDGKKAGSAAMIAVMRFFDYYDQWPEDLRKKIDQLETNSDYPTVASLLAAVKSPDPLEPMCVEVLANILSTTLKIHEKKNILISSPAYSEVEVKALKDKYKEVTLDVNKDSNLSNEFPINILRQVADQLHIASVETLVLLLKSVSHNLYSGLLAGILPNLIKNKALYRQFRAFLQENIFNQDENVAILKAIFTLDEADKSLKIIKKTKNIIKKILKDVPIEVMNEMLRSMESLRCRSVLIAYMLRYSSFRYQVTFLTELMSGIADDEQYLIFKQLLATEIDRNKPDPAFNSKVIYYIILKNGSITKKFIFSFVAAVGVDSQNQAISLMNAIPRGNFLDEVTEPVEDGKSLLDFAAASYEPYLMREIAARDGVNLTVLKKRIESANPLDDVSGLIQLLIAKTESGERLAVLMRNDNHWIKSLLKDYQFKTLRTKVINHLFNIFELLTIEERKIFISIKITLENGSEIALLDLLGRGVVYIPEKYLSVPRIAFEMFEMLVPSAKSGLTSRVNEFEQFYSFNKPNKTLAVAVRETLFSSFIIAETINRKLICESIENHAFVKRKGHFKKGQNHASMPSAERLYRLLMKPCQQKNSIRDMMRAGVDFIEGIYLQHDYEFKKNLWDRHYDGDYHAGSSQAKLMMVAVNEQNLFLTEELIQLYKAPLSQFVALSFRMYSESLMSHFIECYYHKCFELFQSKQRETLFHGMMEHSNAHEQLHKLTFLNMPSDWVEECYQAMTVYSGANLWEILRILLKHGLSLERLNQPMSSQDKRCIVERVIDDCHASEKKDKVFIDRQVCLLTLLNEGINLLICNKQYSVYEECKKLLFPFELNKYDREYQLLAPQFNNDLALCRHLNIAIDSLNKLVKEFSRTHGRTIKTNIIARDMTLKRSMLEDILVPAITANSYQPRLEALRAAIMEIGLFKYQSQYLTFDADLSYSSYTRNVFITLIQDVFKPDSVLAFLLILNPNISAYLALSQRYDHFVTVERNLDVIHIEQINFHDAFYQNPTLLHITGTLRKLICVNNILIDVSGLVNDDTIDFANKRLISEHEEGTALIKDNIKEIHRTYLLRLHVRYSEAVLKLVEFSAFNSKAIVEFIHNLNPDCIFECVIAAFINTSKDNSTEVNFRQETQEAIKIGLSKYAPSTREVKYYSVPHTFFALKPGLDPEKQVVTYRLPLQHTRSKKKLMN